MKYYLIAGEASGDLHAANLMHALKTCDSKAEFRFFGGDLMQAEGGILVKHYKELAYMGFIPVIMNLRTILTNLKLCKNDIKIFAPDVIILVDYPGFNLRIAKYVKKSLQLPVYYFISPKIWAWKEYRIKHIKKYVDKMISILPFEVPFYAKHAYPIEYVGNPTVDAIAGRVDATETFKEFISIYQLPEKPIIALLPGSRKQEIKTNLPIMIDAIRYFSECQFVIAGAPGISTDFYQSIPSVGDIPILFAQTYRLLQQSKMALVTSGTATLETALLRIPQIVCYHVGGGKFAYWAFKTFLHVNYISLVNLIAEKEVVKELMAHLFTVENLRQEAEMILYKESYQIRMLAGYDEVIRILGPVGASEKAAQVIYHSLLK